MTSSTLTAPIVIRTSASNRGTARFSRRDTRFGISDRARVLAFGRGNIYWSRGWAVLSSRYTGGEASRCEHFSAGTGQQFRAAPQYPLVRAFHDKPSDRRPRAL